MAISLVITLVIVVRKFPQVANVDVDNLPKEKEARKKKEIMDRRIKVERGALMTKFGILFHPVEKMWRQFQLKFRVYVGVVERVKHREDRRAKKQKDEPAPAEQENKVQTLLNDAQMYVQQGDFDKAEGVYIAAIKIDARSYEAYRGLADTYLAKGSLDEALETYEFLIQIHPKDDFIMAKISEVAEQKGDIEKAIEFLQQAVVLNDALSPRYHHLAELLVKYGQNDAAKEAIVAAVELEPKNPKYLDLLIEIGILCGDKDLAAQGFAELRLVNPKNQKLQVFSDRIKAL